jgi:signal transduction histidine kinase
MQQPSLPRKPKARIVGLLFLLVLWLVFAVWQRTEYVHQSVLIQNSLVSQAEALSGAVSSGVQSHRWFSPFVQQQLPETLGVLARSKHVIAIALVVNDDAQDVYYSGDRERVDFSLPVGQHARDDLLQVVSRFTLRNNPPMMRAEFPEFAGRAETDSFKSIIVLDRSATIAQIRREARNRMLIFVMGTLLLLAVGAVWQFTVRLAQSEGTTRLLRAETRHLRELGQAAAGLAHETRNPLGLIRGWSQRLIESGLPSDDQQEQAEAVLEECDRVTARINQFLAFARQAEVETGPVAVDELVQELQTLLQPDLDAHALKLETVHLDDPAAIQADRDQLRQVLFNLLQNAIAFAPAGTAITISLRHSQRGLYRLEVADQGPGAADEIGDSLFEPYVTKRPGGTGLG